MQYLELVYVYLSLSVPLPPHLPISLIHFVLCGFHGCPYCVFCPCINIGTSNQYHFVSLIAYMNARFSYVTPMLYLHSFPTWFFLCIYLH